MRKRVIISTLLLAILITGFIFILKMGHKGPEGGETKKRVIVRKYVSVNFHTDKAIGFKDEINRILPYKDSAIIFEDTTIYIVNNDLSFKRLALVPFNGFHQARYLYIKETFFAGLDFKPNSLYMSDARLNSVSPEIFFSNAVYCNGKMYANKNNLGNGIFSIDSWDPLSGSSQSILDLKQFLKNEISHCDQCFGETLEGNFFRIDDNSFGFYFYRGGYFLVYNKEEFKLKKTIVDYPFLVFRKKAVKLPGGLTGSQCSSERDVWVQMSACSNGKEIFVLSNVIQPEFKERAIDVYSADSLGYVKSYSLPDYKEGKPNDILFTGGRLLVAYDNNFLVSYTVEEK
jgi:hypothetical protein